LVKEERALLKSVRVLKTKQPLNIGGKENEKHIIKNSIRICIINVRNSDCIYSKFCILS